VSPIEKTAQEFDSVASEIERALAYDPHGNTLADIRRMVLEGSMQLWTGEGFVGVTEVVSYPNMKVVVVCLAAGKKEAVVQAYHDKIHPFAKVIGARGVEILGRAGWARVLDKHGFRQSSVTLFKEV
jgi:hypothetical protein